MTASFTVTKGSLPELRFGANYRLRARAVDLAGNSVPVDIATPKVFAAPADGVQLKYQRFEPVSPPLMVLRQPTQAGSSLERLVIRSRNTNPSMDATLTSEEDQRHIAPPRVAVRMAEQHGMLDDHGKLKGDLATYKLIVDRDKFEFATQGNNQDKVPLESGPVLDVGYLPDPIARGVALRDLPNTPTGTNGRIGKNSLQYKSIPDVDARAGSVTFIDFGAQPWPNATSFRLVLVEGSAAPQWDAKARVLTAARTLRGARAERNTESGCGLSVDSDER
jgi:hypothetical protein